MSNWPPDPNKAPENNPAPNNNSNNQSPRSLPVSSGGREWHLLEKTLMASIEEQRRARRWRVISKVLSLLTLLLLFFMLSRSCTPTESISTVDVTKPHIAVVDVEGVIAADTVTNSYDISAALTEAFKSKGKK